MTLNGAKHACSRHRECGPCTNNKVIAAQTVQKRVLAGLKAHLLNRARRRQAIAQRLPVEREPAEMACKLKCAQMMFMEKMISMDDLKARTAPLAERRTELQAPVAMPPDSVVVHPGAAEGEDVRNELRKLIDYVKFTPQEGLA